jgi:hypothetical protein
MRKTIVFLPSPSACLDIIDAGNISSPVRLPSHLVELAVLDHHGMKDSQKRFVRRKHSNPARQGMSLKENLALMLTMDIDQSAATGIRKFVPLKVSIRVVENSVEFVAQDLVR